jgi:hypothetical protein
MGKILIVEPHRVLQQAISAALVTEHEVESRKILDASEVEAVEDYDLVVIDADAAGNDGELRDALRKSKAPVLWLQAGELPAPLRPDRFASVKMPLERSSFASAVGELLAGKPAGKSGSSDDDKTEAEAAPRDKQAPEPADQRHPQPIDLIDVVEQKKESSERKPR